MQYKIEILLSTENQKSAPIIFFNSEKIILKGEHTIKTDVATDKEISFDVESIEDNAINVEQILINDCVMDKFPHSKFQFNSIDVTQESIERIDNTGTYTLKVDKTLVECTRSDYWKISNHNKDYIYNIIFHDDKQDTGYKPRNHAVIKNDSICVLGDSFTFGWGIAVADTWPTLLEQKIKQPVMNLAVSGAGIDIVYNNFKKLLTEYQFSKIIINLPVFTRRVVKCKLPNGYYKIPNTYLPDIDHDNSFLYFNHAEVSKARKLTEQKMVKDVDCLYQKKILQRLFKLGKQHGCTFITSRFDDVYKYVQDHYDNKFVLPKWQLENYDRHPTKKDNEKFVDSITSFL